MKYFGSKHDLFNPLSAAGKQDQLLILVNFVVTCFIKRLALYFSRENWNKSLQIMKPNPENILHLSQCKRRVG